MERWFGEKRLLQLFFPASHPRPLRLLLVRGRQPGLEGARWVKRQGPHLLGAWGAEGGRHLNSPFRVTRKCFNVTFFVTQFLSKGTRVEQEEREGKRGGREDEYLAP